MPVLIDMVGREVKVPDFPKRIISLCPSQTLTLADLGVGDRLVGITRFCIHPDEIWRTVKRVGGTKRINYEAILELKPDLIIAEKEENTAEMVYLLEKDFPVFVTDVLDIPTSFEMVEFLGKLTQTETKALQIIQEMKDAIGRINPLPSLECAYFIWRDPWMVAGRNNFINSILEVCGLRNVFTGLPERYPRVQEDMMQVANPTIVLLSDEPYPFAENHIEEFRLVLAEADFFLVNGEFFSWYGSRIRTIDGYINPLLNQIRTRQK